MNLLLNFLPGRISSLTLSALMSSVLTDYVSVHVCIGYIPRCRMLCDFNTQPRAEAV